MGRECRQGAGGGGVEHRPLSWAMRTARPHPLWPCRRIFAKQSFTHDVVETRPRRRHQHFSSFHILKHSCQTSTF
jgi:hypothetical protein